MRTIVPVAAIAAALLLAGCAPAPTGLAGAESAPRTAPGDAPAVQAPDGLEAAGQPSLDAAEQAIVVTGWVSLVADAPVEAADAAASLATDAGGAVASRTESAGAGDVPERATLTLRVPADEVDALLDDLRGLGDVRDVDVSSVDVTQEVRDLDVRVASTRASVDRLTTLLGTAADTGTLLEIEAQLTARTGELESLLAQQAALADRVALSTITIAIASRAVEPAAPATFLDGLAAGWASLVAAGGALLVGVGAALPWLAVAGVLGAALALVVRRARRRAASPSAPPDADAVSHLA